ncbi:MAG: DegT/DnrJ/EryC1/StrS aminotransferase family protein [Chitinophagales bacterium]|nr:DegT/DnrJ/EryC1/StrS aminotransferase family protein [Chitinophagales bacterium]
MIPFSPPYISDDIIREVVDALKSGWITTGPRTKQLEKELAGYVNAEQVLCVNSATAGLELMLRWFGVKEGDEVIVPAYTYSATANVVIHCGARPVLADVNADDFNISVDKIRAAISPRTKVIMPVDIGGFPCDYDAVNRLVREEWAIRLFTPRGASQEALGRILVLSDAAHSIGASAHGKKTGSLTDATVFSFHAVKNLTTAEGGAVCLNLPAPFNNNAVYRQLNTKSLHGQNKDALAKMQKGSWEYDIVEAGMKCNMPDVLAAIGLASLRDYESVQLLKRKQVIEQYHAAFKEMSWAQLPVTHTGDRASSCHLYMLRIHDIDEQQRNAVIQKIFDQDVAVNVHFKPLPMLTYYKELGYDIHDYPVAYDNYAREISLPVYVDLTKEQISMVVTAVAKAVKEVLQAG